MPAADPDAPWLVLYALVTFTSGNADALRLRAEWLPAGSSTWVAGDMKGLTAPVGSFTQLGIGAKPGVMQGVEVLVQRPAGLGADADGVRLVLQKTSAVTTAVDCDVHLVGLRKAQRRGDRRRAGAGRARGGGVDALDHDHRRRRTRWRRCRPVSRRPRPPASPRCSRRPT